jgi:hypothetical protein
LVTLALNTFLHFTPTTVFYSLFLILVNIGLIFLWVIVNHIRQSIRSSADETDTESNLEEDSSITLSSTLPGGDLNLKRNTLIVEQQ